MTSNNDVDTANQNSPGSGVASRFKRPPFDLPQPPSMSLRAALASRKAEITILGRTGARVWPGDKIKFLKPALEHRIVDFVSEGARGMCAVWNTVATCSRREPPRLPWIPTWEYESLYIHAGSVARVKALLEHHDWQVTIRDVRQEGPRLQPALVTGVSVEDRLFLEAVAGNFLGQIEIKSPDEFLTKCTLLERLFPSARFGVAVSSRKLGHHLWRQLQRMLWQPVGFQTTGSRCEGWRWLVFTYGHASKCPKLDVLLIPRGEDLASVTNAFWTADHLHAHRLFAFVQHAQRYGDFTRFLLEAAAGTLIYRSGPVMAPVAVLFMPTSDVRIQAPGDPLERKRALYWHNHDRNRRISWLARCFAAGRYSAAVRDKLLASGVVVDRPLSVSILVESTEHATELAALLPGWPVQCGSNLQVDVAHTPYKIVTMVRAVQEGLATDVLIRGTGGADILQVADFPPLLRATPVVLVDFNDAFDPRAAREAEHRIRTYSTRGWR